MVDVTNLSSTIAAAIAAIFSAISALVLTYQIVRQINETRILRLNELNNRYLNLKKLDDQLRHLSRATEGGVTAYACAYYVYTKRLLPPDDEPDITKLLDREAHAIAQLGNIIHDYAEFWDNFALQYESGMLPGPVFKISGNAWSSRAMNYLKYVEPLDLANWYALDMHGAISAGVRDGMYMAPGKRFRPSRYSLLERKVRNMRGKKESLDDIVDLDIYMHQRIRRLTAIRRR